MFKRNEDLYLQRAKDHIEKTYQGHYVNDSNIQAVDLWEAQGSLLTTARDTAEKYLMRFGKKNGENLEDLYKAIHFIVMMIHVVEKKRADTKPLKQVYTILKKADLELQNQSSCERGDGGEDVVREFKGPPDDILFDQNDSKPKVNLFVGGFRVTDEGAVERDQKAKQNFHNDLVDKTLNWKIPEPDYSQIRSAPPDEFHDGVVERANVLLSNIGYKPKT